MRTTLILLVSTASGCVFYPRTKHPDADCRTITRKLRLDATQVMGFECTGGDPRACLASLAAAGLISASTAVVSGSIVVVNNTVSWLEVKGRCGGKTPPPLSTPGK